jgi:hypothetical protein
MKAARQGQSTFHLFISACVICAGFAAVGCNTVPGAKFQEVQRKVQSLEEKNDGLQQQLTEQRATITNLREQVNRLRGIEGDRFEQLIYPEKIVLERMSGGYDRDGQPGDDGLVLFIQPIDRDGHVIKAAGELNATLLDMHEPASPVVIASYEFDANKTRELWYGKLLTNHWTVRCPWPPNGPPSQPEVTVEIQFTDLLTGNVLKTRGVYKVALPPGPKEKTVTAQD